jgi:hypothetical protein
MALRLRQEAQAALRRGDGGLSPQPIRIALPWGLDDGSGGAGIPTLGCAKNDWVDFDG